MGAAGLNAERSGHFGHCDCFTVVDIVDGVVSEEATMVANPPHEEGGCLRPVGLLADAGCNAIVAAGMGMRPLMGFNQAGITVYYDAEHPIVGDAVRAVAAGEAPIRSADQACHHHHWAFPLRGGSIELPRFFVRRNRVAAYRVARIDTALR